MVLFLIVGAAAFAGERAYTHHKKSKAKKLAKLQPQAPAAAVTVTNRSVEVVEEEVYEDLPVYQKDVQEVEGQPPMYSRMVSEETIPIPERSPLREKVAM